MSGQKTEPPTPKRLQEARKQGQIARSIDLTQSVLFLASGGLLMTLGGGYINFFEKFMIESFSPPVLARELTGNAILIRAGHGFLQFMLLSLPLLGGLFVVSAAISFLQTGVIISPGGLTPKFSRLNPVQGFQNLFFKARTWLELIKNLIKFVVVLALAYFTVHSQLRDVILSARVNLAQTAQLGSKLLFSLLFRIGGALLVLGALDYMLQKRMVMKSLMMSKEDVTREYKQEEGDPHVKHQRKHLHEQLLSESALHNVPKADAVVINPTHFAVALQYKPEAMSAPRVTAKGQMKNAQRIIQVARRHHVPVIRNVPLARGLYKTEVGHSVPEEFYEPVAEILNWVYQIARERKEF